MASVTGTLTVVKGSTFDSFLEEEVDQSVAMIDLGLKLLDDYATVRDQERYAIALAKTYNKRRQTAYKAYLKIYDALQKDEAFTPDIRRLFDRKLEDINQFIKKA